MAKYNQPAKKLNLDKERDLDHEEPTPSILDPHVLDELKVKPPLMSTNQITLSSQEDPALRTTKTLKFKPKKVADPFSEQVVLNKPRTPTQADLDF